MTGLPDVLKIELRIEVNGQPLLIQAQVQGEGEAAQRAAAELSSALTNVLNAVTKPGAADRPSPAHGADGPVSLPAANQIASTQPAAPPPTQSVAAKAEDTKHPLVALAQRYRVRINLGFGGLLLALAILAPIVAPAAQRREMLIVTLLLGLTAALMLFTAMLPGPERAAAPRASAQPRPAQPVSRAQVRKALLAQRRSPLSAGAGLALGVAFLLLGMLGAIHAGRDHSRRALHHHDWVLADRGDRRVSGVYLLAARFLRVRLSAPASTRDSRPALACDTRAANSELSRGCASAVVWPGGVRHRCRCRGDLRHGERGAAVMRLNGLTTLLL
jgi:hypothetical protein